MGCRGGVGVVAGEEGGDGAEAEDGAEEGAGLGHLGDDGMGN